MQLSRLRAFQDTIASARIRIGRVAFEWYPYDTLANLNHVEQLLSQDLDTFLKGACPNRRILDVGCGDGELAFFLESLGYDVVAIDHPTHNHNGMQGVRALRARLESSIEIHEVDLDRQFQLPHKSYDAIIFLGVLYHLRNPFYVLEELARRAKYCLVSTRVARRFPNGDRMPKDVALAYLLNELELNQDESNYFIFSEHGLRVLVERSYWQIRNSRTVGDTHRSDPIRRDERIFCLLESTYDRLNNVELLEGWYDGEGSGWRWTRQEFALKVRVGKSPVKRNLTMEVFVPAGLLARVPSITLWMQADRAELPAAVLEKPGTHHLVRPFESAGREEMRFDFRLSHALAGDDADSRDRGIIVSAVTIE